MFSDINFPTLSIPSTKLKKIKEKDTSFIPKQGTDGFKEIYTYIYIYAQLP